MHDKDKMQNEGKPNHGGNIISHSRKWQELELQIWQVTSGVLHFPAPDVMYLGRGWKTFARIHSLTEGLTLHFKLMEGGLLSVKFFGCFGTRARCCVDSSSDSEDSSSSGNDEEDSDSDDVGGGRQDDGSD